MQKTWALPNATELFKLPLLDLLYTAQTTLREYFKPNEIQISTLLNIKTGGCSENCCYCAQSAHNKTGLRSEPIMAVKDVIMAAEKAKDAGATRFCMGTVGRSPNDRDLKIVCEMISAVKQLGLETCVTLGILTEDQVVKLKDVGLDYYNHNINTAPAFYPKIVTTHTFEDRLNTIKLVRKHGIKVCCGGIIGMGESNVDRIKMLVLLANLDPPPEAVPINKLLKIPGTPFANQPDDVDPFDFVRTIALARIMMPKSYVRISAGRQQMSDELQVLCFMAGANSVFCGEKLLTTTNRTIMQDDILFTRIGLTLAKSGN